MSRASLSTETHRKGKLWKSQSVSTLDCFSTLQYSGLQPRRDWRDVALEWSYTILEQKSSCLWFLFAETHLKLPFPLWNQNRLTSLSQTIVYYPMLGCIHSKDSAVQHNITYIRGYTRSNFPTHGKKSPWNSWSLHFPQTKTNNTVQNTSKITTDPSDIDISSSCLLYDGLHNITLNLVTGSLKRFRCWSPYSRKR